MMTHSIVPLVQSANGANKRYHSKHSALVRNLCLIPSNQTNTRMLQCNREWPCNHCQKRKVADKCCFSPSSTQEGPERTFRQANNRKRQLSHEESIDEVDSTSWDDVECDFESLGYTASHLFGGLNSSSTVGSHRQFRAALQVRIGIQKQTYFSTSLT